MAVERVQIVTEVIDKATGRLRKVQEVTRQVNNLQGRSVEVTRRLNESTNRMDITNRKTTQGLRRFNFAWLSVMFAGMALQRVFGGLIKSQLQLFGVTDLFSGVLTLVMLPVMQALLPLFLGMAEFFMNLPDSVKMAIGIFIILGFVFGLILMVVGQVMLAVGGFVLLLPSIATVGGPIIAALVASLGTVILVIGIIIALVIALVIAWRKNFLNMRHTVAQIWAGLKQTFGGLINVFKGIFKILKGIFTGDFSLVLEGAKLLWKGFINFLLGIWKFFTNAIVAIFKAAFMIVYNIIKVIIDGVVWAINKLASLTGRGSRISSPFPEVPSFQTGGIMPHTGLAFLHRGERVIPANQVTSPQGDIVINQTNNINVSDREEMQKMIDDNNLKVVEDIKRQINI